MGANCMDFLVGLVSTVAGFFEFLEIFHLSLVGVGEKNLGKEAKPSALIRATHRIRAAVMEAKLKKCGPWMRKVLDRLLTMILNYLDLVTDVPWDYEGCI